MCCECFDKHYIYYKSALIPLSNKRKILVFDFYILDEPSALDYLFPYIIEVLKNYDHLILLVNQKLDDEEQLECLDDLGYDFISIEIIKVGKSRSNIKDIL